MGGRGQVTLPGEPVFAKAYQRFFVKTVLGKMRVDTRRSRCMIEGMKKKRTYFPPTTAQQRQLLFKTWEETGSVTEACAKAHVSRQTFYNWKPRFEAGGYEALNVCRSHAPHNPKRTAPEVEAQVLELRRQQLAWGKQRMADELAKRNSWVPVVSANTVKRILLEAGLWQPKNRPEKKRHSRSKARGRSGANDQC